MKLKQNLHVQCLDRNPLYRARPGERGHRALRSDCMDLRIDIDVYGFTTYRQYFSYIYNGGSLFRRTAPIESPYMTGTCIRYWGSMLTRNSRGLWYCTAILNTAALVVSTEGSSVYNIYIYNVHQIATLFKEKNCELKMAVFVSMIRLRQCMYMPVYAYRIVYGTTCNIFRSTKNVILVLTNIKPFYIII